MERKLNSLSAMGRNLVMEYMETHEQATRKELSEYILLKASEMKLEGIFTEGIIAGVTKVLLADGELVNIQRGIYVKGEKKANGCSYEKIVNICEKFKKDLRKSCNINVLELSDGEQSVYGEFFKELKNLKTMVEEKVESLNTLLERAMEQDEMLRADQEENVPMPDANVDKEESKSETGKEERKK